MQHYACVRNQGRSYYLKNRTPKVENDGSRNGNTVDFKEKQLSRLQSRGQALTTPSSPLQKNSEDSAEVRQCSSDLTQRVTPRDHMIWGHVEFER